MTNDELRRLLLRSFADEAAEQLQRIEEGLTALGHARPEAKSPLVEDLFRRAHSLKAAARAAELDRAERAAHELEDLFRAIQEGRASKLEEAHRTLDALAAAVPCAQPAPPSGRVSQILDTAPHIVRDLLRELSKQVEVTVHGGELEADAAVLEQLRSPLTHMVRNSVVHGIEDPATRVAAGKRRQGKVTLSAYRQDADLVIEVSDDGAGIDVEKLKATAVENGVVSFECASAMSEREALRLILRPGLSTQDEVTRLSGRGVGMDVVREQVERLNGTIDVESIPGEGTSISLTVRPAAA